MRTSIMVLTLVILGVLGHTEPAKAACVEKIVTDGHLIALVPDADVGSYESLGFVVAQCPADYDAGPGLAEAWCSSFADFEADRKQSFVDKFGVTTDQVCAAARAYFASQ